MAHAEASVQAWYRGYKVTQTADEVTLEIPVPSDCASKDVSKGFKLTTRTIHAVVRGCPVVQVSTRCCFSSMIVLSAPA